MVSQANGRVFFWLSEYRLEKLRNAPAYQQREHDILTVDTKSLVDAHAAQIELCHLNSARYIPPLTIRAARAASRSPAIPGSSGSPPRRAEPIVELTIPHSAPDVERFVVDGTTR